MIRQSVPGIFQQPRLIWINAHFLARLAAIIRRGSASAKEVGRRGEKWHIRRWARQIRAFAVGGPVELQTIESKGRRRDANSQLGRHCRAGARDQWRRSGGDHQDWRGCAVQRRERGPWPSDGQGLRPLSQAARQGHCAAQGRAHQARRGPADRRGRQDRGDGTDHQRQGEHADRLLILAVGNRAGAGRDAGQGADDHLQRRHRVDHQPVALHRTAIVQHVASGLPDGRLRVQQGRLQDGGDGLHGLPARQGLDGGVQDRLREGRRQDRRLDPDGIAGAGAGLHPVLPENQGRASRLARMRPAS